jgi:nitrogen fixation protein NifU and related proteins
MHQCCFGSTSNFSRRESLGEPQRDRFSDGALKMNDIASDFWNRHSNHFLEMAFRTDRCEVIEKPAGYGKNTGDCGDTVEIFLTVEKDRIQYVSFVIDGCINTRAAANTVAEMAEGRLVDQAWRITPDDVAAYLETLPADSYHCAELAVGALYRALTDYRNKQQNPWKKAYLPR